MGRGGAISNILAKGELQVMHLQCPKFTSNSQARASLKNPSRPFTPADNARSLFGGSDYRPSSRPSSTFSVSSAFGDQPPSPQSSTSPRKYKGGVSSRNSSRSRSSREGPVSNSTDKPPLGPGSAQDWGWSQGKEEENVPNHEEESPAPAPESFSKPPTHTSQTAVVRGRRRKSKKATDEAVPSPWDTSPTVSDSDMDQMEDTAMSSSCATAIEALLPSLKASTSVGELCDKCDQLSPLVDKLPSGGDSPEVVLEVQQKTLQTVSKLMVDVPPKLMVKLARLALNLVTSDWLEQDATSRTTGAVLRPSVALKSICQLLLKLSKDEANDALFREEKAAAAILALLNQTLSSQSSSSSRRKGSKERQNKDESVNGKVVNGKRAGDLPFPFDVLIYACGTLKNISNNESNQKALAQEGAVTCLANMLFLASPGGKWFSTAGESKSAQLLVQITATLRNLALSKKLLKPFWDADVVPGLCALLGTLKMHAELCLNVARILAKLTYYEPARAAVNRDQQNVLMMLSVLKTRKNRNNVLDDMASTPASTNANALSLSLSASEKEKEKDEPAKNLVVRICFTLGNLTSGLVS